MIQLEPDECRVLGVLIEKAYTTPTQYPMSVNAIMVGCNQKSNRDPVVNYDEDRALSAVDRLRGKRLVTEVHLTGSRVIKFRQEAQEALSVRAPQMAVLAELLLRGPQTVGELRGRASRIHQLESLEVVHNILDDLMGREEPMVQKLPPLPGSRAERYAQLLCPELHPLGPTGPVTSETTAASSPSPFAASPKPEPDAMDALRGRVDMLEQQLADLQRKLDDLLN